MLFLQAKIRRWIWRYQCPEYFGVLECLGDSSHRSGFGAQVTDNKGAYEFQTLVPVPYPGRPPHIHTKLWNGQVELLTTQVYLEGHAGAAGRKIDPQEVLAGKASRVQYQADFNFVLEV